MSCVPFAIRLPQRALFDIDAQYHSKGPVLSKWHPSGAFLATCGANRVVNIFNRQGVHQSSIPLEGGGRCLQLDWDPQGETLAILQHGSPIVKLWDANQGVESSLDTLMKDLTYVRWAGTMPLLAIGTAKGNLLLYDKRTLKKQSIMGKHSKQITGGAWNSASELALASSDKQITVSNAEGETLLQQSLRGEPSELRFHRGGPDGDGGADDQRETTLSAIVGGKWIMCFDASDPEQLRGSKELTFQTHYGGIVSYEWFGDHFVCIAFESGFVVVMSASNSDEPSEELFASKLFSGNLSSLAVSPLLSRAAVCSGSTVKLVALSGSDPSSYKELVEEEQKIATNGASLDSIEWTSDGQILTVCSDAGVVYNFLASLPVLAATHGSRYMYLTSLLELSVCDSEDASAAPLEVRVAMEPTFVALGPSHVALGMNNHVLFHSLGVEGCPLTSEKEYLGTVEAIQLNSNFCAVLSEGRVTLDSVADEDQGGIGAVSRVFPEAKDGSRDVTCLALTKDFLLYGTQSGVIAMVYLPDLTLVSEYRHDAPIAALFPNTLGTRVAFLDATQSGHLLSPVDDTILPIPKLPAQCKGILWDRIDAGILMAHGAHTFSVYLYSPHSISGHTLAPIDVSVRYPSPSLSPILLAGGTAICQEPNGTTSSVVLPTHEAIAMVDRKGGASPEKIRVCFHQTLKIGRLQRAWDLAALLKEQELFIALGEASMRALDIPMAMRCYRQLGDAGMVLSLQKLEGLEDAHVLSGHLALVFDDHASAQDHFLKSTRPLAALEMRRDLLHWEQALKLAKTLAVEQVPTISREFAKQLEFREQYEQALKMYHAGLGDAPQGTGMPWKDDPPHERLCRVGIAKMMLRLGDVTRGVQMAFEGQDRDCCRDCAAILEAQKNLGDAARLYEMGEQLDKAAAIYIKIKNWGAVSPLMAKISSPKLHSEYAKAKEAEGAYQEAANAYEKATDLDSVVRLLLGSLNNPTRAMQIVRETRSPQGALLVANFAQEKEDHSVAIEFLVLAKRPQEGFDLASKHDVMETYTTALGGSGTLDENRKVALYYETKGDALRAGEFWFSCKEYSKALRLFLQCGERAVDQAIEVVGRARSDMLTHTLIDFLMGETDGVPKDPNYIFRLYMALGNYPQAAKTAIIISRQEQELGNYRIAHGILFETHRELTAQSIRVPQELAINLMLLHSYVLVRPLTKMGDHLSGARMLIRVAKHISKFPMHIVPILTSTVIECHRAGLRNSAFDFATTLMRPEYRSQIGDAYKRKIEAIVRKPGERNDLDEPETPSPFDPKAMTPETHLECPSTRNTLPYCIATGRHVVLNDLTLCPSCSFPALFSEFTKMIESESQCPMCQQEVNLSAVRKMEESEASDWLHGATKKENAGRRWGDAGLSAAVKGGGMGSLMNSLKGKSNLDREHGRGGHDTSKAGA